MSKNHVNTVSAIYEAFSRGDIPAILEHLSNDIQWESWGDNYAQKSGVPWMAKQQGKSGAAAFFGIVGDLQIRDFRVLSIMGGDNQVAAEIEIDFFYPKTGAQIKDQEIQLWSFNESGKILRLRHYIDTAKHIAAAQV